MPILVASKGPRMLDLTARHADAWNVAWFGLPDERLAGRRADLAAACARVGRDPATLTITVGIEVRYPDADGRRRRRIPMTRSGLTGTPDEIAAGLRAHAAAGADHLIAVLDPCTPGTVAAFAEAVAAVPRGRRVALAILDPAGATVAGRSAAPGSRSARAAG